MTWPACVEHREWERVPLKQGDSRISIQIQLNLPDHKTFEDQTLLARIIRARDGSVEGSGHLWSFKLASEGGKHVLELLARESKKPCGTLEYQFEGETMKLKGKAVDGDRTIDLSGEWVLEKTENS